MQSSKAPRRLGVDTAGYFTPYSQSLWNHGCRTVFRYLSLEKEAHCEPDLGHWRVFISQQELEELVEAGWHVGLVQQGIGSNYDPNRSAADQGAQYGAAAVWQVEKLCGVKGIVLWCDCEFTADLSKEDQTAFIEAWAKECYIGSQIGGQYVSTELKLSSRELYGLAYVKAYWKSASMVPTVDTRGYQVLQSLEYFAYGDKIEEWDPDKHAGIIGIRVDLDMLCVDGRGDWMRAIAK